MSAATTVGAPADRIGPHLGLSISARVMRTSAAAPEWTGGIENPAHARVGQASLVHRAAVGWPPTAPNINGLGVVRQGAQTDPVVSSAWGFEEGGGFPLAPIASRAQAADASAPQGVNMPLVMRPAAVAAVASDTFQADLAAAPPPMSASAPSPAAIAALELQQPSGSTHKHPDSAAHGTASASTIDLDNLVEMTWRAVMTKLVIERERRGYGRWN
jgi:hypothetical protein